MRNCCLLLLSCCFCSCLLVRAANDDDGRTLSIVDFGAVPHSKFGSYQPLIFTEFHEMDDDIATSASFDLNQRVLTDVLRTNTQAFNQALQAARPGDTVLIPKNETFNMTGGVFAKGLHHVTIDFAGTLHFVHHWTLWPYLDSKSRMWGQYGYKTAIHIIDSTNITLTCSAVERPTVYIKKHKIYLSQRTGHAGIIHGYGRSWWDAAITGSLPNKDDTVRPRLVLLDNIEDLLVENLTLINSPFWTLTLVARNAEVRQTHVLVDRSYEAPNLANADVLGIMDIVLPPDRPRQHIQNFILKSIVRNLPDWFLRNARQPQDLNTDGIDPVGENIWIHDCIIQNSDDSVAVKPNIVGHLATIQGKSVPCTRNVTIEDMVLTGFGASIGSVGPKETVPCVENVTFRNISMPYTGKGIYVKSNQAHNNCKNESSFISNVLYEDVKIYRPFWWAIWIGPQQQHEPGTEVGKNCPLSYPIAVSCPVPVCTTFTNITLRNIRIEDPLLSPGAILANESNPFQNIMFENVTVVRKKHWWRALWPFKRFGYAYHCMHVDGTCRDCHPAPSCFVKA